MSNPLIRNISVAILLSLETQVCPWLQAVLPAIRSNPWYIPCVPWGWYSEFLGILGMNLHKSKNVTEKAQPSLSQLNMAGLKMSTVGRWTWHQVIILADSNAGLHQKSASWLTSLASETENPGFGVWGPPKSSKLYTYTYTYTYYIYIELYRYRYRYRYICGVVWLKMRIAR